VGELVVVAGALHAAGAHDDVGQAGRLQRLLGLALEGEHAAKDVEDGCDAGEERACV
jgi:hypothetical protein